MNKHYLLALLDESVKTVSCKFDKNFKGYTYKTRLDLAIGDKVLVDTPSNGLQVVEITEVHELPELDANTSTDYKWIIQKVDLTEYEANVAADAERYKGVHKAMIANHRERMKAQLLEQMPFLVETNCRKDGSQ